MYSDKLQTKIISSCRAYVETKEADLIIHRFFNDLLDHLISRTKIQTADRVNFILENASHLDEDSLNNILDLLTDIQDENELKEKELPERESKQMVHSFFSTQSIIQKEDLTQVTEMLSQLLAATVEFSHIAGQYYTLSLDYKINDKESIQNFLNYFIPKTFNMRDTFCFIALSTTDILQIKKDLKSLSIFKDFDEKAIQRLPHLKR